MLSVPSLLSQSTPSLTISETDSLYMAVTTLHQELKSYAPEPCSNSREGIGDDEGLSECGFAGEFSYTFMMDIWIQSLCSGIIPCHVYYYSHDFVLYN